LSEEYEDEFDSAEHDGVPPAVAPSAKLDGVRTIDRRLGPAIVALILIAGAGLFWVMHSSAQSMASVADAHQPVLVSTAALRLPAPSPTPLALAPSPVATLRPQTPIPVAIAVPQEAAPSQAQPKTPSPEEVFAEEERRRVLETRRASSRVLFDNDRDLAAQTDRDERDLAHGSQQMTGSAPAALAQTSGVGVAAQGPHAQFIAQQGGAPGYMPTTTQYELRRGTVINANWSTTLDSTLPGGVLVARVSENVKDSITHSVVVLPAGTIITGGGDSQTQAGEARYLCFWDEVELPYPDSRKFYMGANPGGGRQGENGVDVSVDTHAGRDFGHASLYSVLQAGVNLASRASTVVDLNNGNMGQVFQPTTRSAPTFHAYVGQPLTIVVGHDLPLDAYRDTR
jgi:type IV secretory pathway VirB10-like protein